MEKVTETWVTAPERPISTTSRHACLVHIYPTGSGMGTRYELSDKSLVIGRGADCDIRINDHSVSRRHAEIRPGAGGWTLEDLGSTNGVRLNGRALEGAQPLSAGDRVELGSTEIVFELG